MNSVGDTELVSGGVDRLIDLAVLFDEVELGAHQGFTIEATDHRSQALGFGWG